ncbi:unnamed protein product [Cochlearia groenlandica]
MAERNKISTSFERVVGRDTYLRKDPEKEAQTVWLGTIMSGSVASEEEETLASEFSLHHSGSRRIRAITTPLASINQPRRKKGQHPSSRKYHELSVYLEI